MSKYSLRRCTSKRYFSESFTHEGDAVTSLLANFDRSWVWGGKNLYGFLEYASLDAGVQVGLGPHSTEYGGVYSSDLDTYLAPGRTFWVRVARYF
jgi:hypothetical protein